MRESPRMRRLRTDRKALEQLRTESTILDFSAPHTLRDNPAESYSVHFRGKGLWRPNGSNDVLIREIHEVSIQLGAAYPRMMPELTWQTPIFHPNISGSGIVCLGGYGTHWVPSLNLDELCVMLWDIVRYANLDVESPYNREAALWAKTQDLYRLPVDPRPLRDRLAGLAPPDGDRKPPITTLPHPVAPDDMTFLDEDGIVDAEVVEPEDPDILFIE
ncbi:MAG: ubiquitin-conjugating enzyme E2 [Pirellulaceae bacterium]